MRHAFAVAHISRPLIRLRDSHPGVGGEDQFALHDGLHDYLNGLIRTDTGRGFHFGDGVCEVHHGWPFRAERMRVV